MRDLNFRSLYKLTVFLVFATIFVYILTTGQSVIVPLVISFFIAFLLIPLCDFLERHHFSRVLAAIVSVIVAIVVLLGLFTLLGSRVSSFAEDFEQVTEKIAQIRSRLPEVVNEQLQGYSADQLITYAKKNFGRIFRGLTGFVSSFTIVFIVPVYIVLILVYRKLLREFLLRVFKAKSAGTNNEENVEEVTDDTLKNKAKGIKELIPRIRLIVQKYITGMFYVIIILFVLYSIALLSLGIEHAILFAAIAASLNIIPFIGPFVGSALPILFAFITEDSLFYPVAVLGSFVLIQSIEGNFLTPKIVGNNVSLNPLVTLITLIVGASIWGVVGMILFIPMVAILKEIFASIHGLEPYSYVLGNGEEDDDSEKSGKKGFMRRLIDKIKDKSSKGQE
jgi:predicted PurR-regulated permease PerM